MAEVIAIANQKGGVGKTMTSVSLSACLALHSKKVLLVDLDPQGHSTKAFGYYAVSYTHLRKYHEESELIINQYY